MVLLGRVPPGPAVIVVLLAGGPPDAPAKIAKAIANSKAITRIISNKVNPLVFDLLILTSNMNSSGFPVLNE